jgi:hypothetical protein
MSLHILGLELCSVHNGYCLQQGMLSSIIDVTAKVLLMDRDPPAMSHEGLLEAPDFNEVPELPPSECQEYITWLPSRTTG